MKIAVLIKQVPDRESPLRLPAGESWIDEASLTFEANESDAYALEEALQIKDRAGGEAEVVALTVGPQRAEKTLRDALARGADRGVLIEREDPLATDPYATAQALATVLRDSACDLVLSGLQSDDLGMGQTGVLVGELLEMATATLITATELGSGSIRVRRELEGGWQQWLTLPLPASLTIQTGINRPRYPTIKGIMAAKRRPVETLAATDLWAGEPLQACRRLYMPQKTQRTELIEGMPQKAAARLLEVLEGEIKVL